MKKRKQLDKENSKVDDNVTRYVKHRVRNDQRLHDGPSNNYVGVKSNLAKVITPITNINESREGPAQFKGKESAERDRSFVLNTTHMLSESSKTRKNFTRNTNSRKRSNNTGMIFSTKYEFFIISVFTII